MTRFFLLCGALLLCACQQVQTTPITDDVVLTHIRPVADALDKLTADLRKARISNLSYDAFIDISKRDDEIVAEVLIDFDLSDASSDLTLDFTGGSLDEVKVNGETIAADYNGYFITLPAAHLQSGSNDVDIAYRRPYGHDGTGLHRTENGQANTNRHRTDTYFIIHPSIYFRKLTTIYWQFYF